MKDYSFDNDPAISWEIVTPETLEANARELADATCLAADVETNGLRVHKGAHIIGHAFAFRRANGQLRSLYMPTRHKSYLAMFDSVPQLNPDHVTAAVKPALEGSALKCGHNFQFDVSMYWKDGSRVGGPVHDTMIAAQLQDENFKSYTLGLCMDRSKITYEQAWKTAIKPDLMAQARELKMKLSELKAKHGYEYCDVNRLGYYACQDAAYELKLAESQFPYCGCWPDIWQMEMELFWVCAEMSWIGVPLDTQVLSSLADEQNSVMAELAPRIYRLAGEEFEITNDTAVRKILFEKLNYPVQGWTQNELPKVDDDSLWSLEKHHQSEIAGLIRRHNSAEKIVSTYTHGIIDLVGDDGLLHGEVKQSGAKTGRVSMSKPNLMNIPVRTPLGRRVREAFVCRPGMLRYCVDYSQVELRVLAHLSQDPLLLKVYREGLDAHRTTALEAFGTADKVDGVDMRRVAKCFHPDTEVLTKRGWVQILDVQFGEEVVQAMPLSSGEVALSWVVPTEVFSMPNPHSELVHLSNEGIDLRVTPDHRMLGWGADDRWFVRMPLEMEKFRYWANAGIAHRSHLPVRTAAVWYQLAVATQADGSYAGKQIRFGFKKSRKIKRFRNFLAAAKITAVKESMTSQGATEFVLRPGPTARIKKLLDGKSFPWKWLQLPVNLRRVVLEELPHWDGHQSPNRRKYSYDNTDLQSVEVMQALAAITGLKTRKVWSGRLWNLAVRDKSTTRGDHVQVKLEAYTGDVACLSVPSSFVLVRDKGVPVVTGQTLNFGIPFGISEKGVQRNINKDLPNGVPELTEDRAAKFLADWYGKYAEVDRYRKALWYQAAQNGGLVWNIFGRPRRVPDILSNQRWKRRAAERKLTSSLVQGSAADLVKHCMVAAWKHLKSQQDVESYLVLMVHDDLQFDMQFDGSAKLIRELTHIMEATCQDKLSVPIVVDTEYFTDNWSNKRSF